MQKAGAAHLLPIHGGNAALPTHGDPSAPGGEEGAHYGHVLQLGAEETVTGFQWANRHKKRLKKCLCLGIEGAEQGQGSQDTALAGFGPWLFF